MYAQWGKLRITLASSCWSEYYLPLTLHHLGISLVHAGQVAGQHQFPVGVLYPFQASLKADFLPLDGPG